MSKTDLKPLSLEMVRFINERLGDLIDSRDSLDMIARSCYIAGLKDGKTATESQVKSPKEAELSDALKILLRNDSIVNAALTQFFCGKMTYVEALELAVVTLAAENEPRLQDLIAAAENALPKHLAKDSNHGCAEDYR